MSRRAEDIPERKAFSRSQREAILLRQSFVGADGVRIACCDECAVHIARLEPDGQWSPLRRFDLDHSLPVALYGKTSVVNGRAICAGDDLSCHKSKTEDDLARIAKADRMGMRSGQQARRLARKLSGKRPQLRSKGFDRHGR